MKLLLVNPYFANVEKHESEAATHTPPLGLGFVGTYVRDNCDCDVEIVDPVPLGLSESEVLEKVKKTDIVGVPCFTDIRFSCLDFARKAKEANRGCTLIIGGPHTYSLDEMILKRNPFIDAVVRGEGELTMADIVNGKPLDEISGISYMRNGEIVRNPDRPFAANIDGFYIDYSLLPDMTLYNSDIEAPMDLKKLKTAYLIESRGCPFQCTYCANDHWRRSFRTVSPRKTVMKMKRMIEENGIEYFRFYDDLFTANRQRVQEFCRAMKEEGVKTKFRVLVRVGTDVKILEALKDIGCESVGIGVESGSDRILKRIRKGITRAQIMETLSDCRKAGLWTIASFIVSLPDESHDDVKRTLELVNLPDVSQVNILHLFPNTPIYNELKARGEIEDSVWFDRERFGGTIHYSKDWFKSAPFTFDEAKWLSLSSKYYSALRVPGKMVKQYGVMAASLWFMMAPVDLALKGRLYRFAFRYRNLYRRMFWRS